MKEEDEVESSRARDFTLQPSGALTNTWHFISRVSGRVPMDIAGKNRSAEASGHHYVAKCDVAFDNFDCDETTCTHAGNAQPLNNSCTDCCFVQLRTFDPATFP